MYSEGVCLMAGRSLTSAAHRAAPARQSSCSIAPLRRCSEATSSDRASATYWVDSARGTGGHDACSPYSHLPQARNNTKTWSGSGWGLGGAEATHQCGQGLEAQGGRGYTPTWSGSGVFCGAEATPQCGQGLPPCSHLPHDTNAPNA